MFAIERLVYERWGGEPTEWEEVQRALDRIARRHGWSRHRIEEVSAQTSNYQGLEWRARWGVVVGWSLHAGNITAVSSRLPTWGLPPEFHFQASGPLFEALNADGSLILPGPEWLLARIPEEERALLRASTVHGGWEAYNFRTWKPHTRAEALFTHWD